MSENSWAEADGSSRGGRSDFDEFEDLLNSHLDTRDRYGRMNGRSRSRSSSPRRLSYREQQQQMTVSRRAAAGLADEAPANPKRPSFRPPPPPPPLSQRKPPPPPPPRTYEVPTDEASADAGDGDGAGDLTERSWSLSDLAAAGWAVPGSRQERERQAGEAKQARKALAAASVAATRAAHREASRVAERGADAEWVRESPPRDEAAPTELAPGAKPVRPPALHDHC